ncbi:MAG: peptide-methionine (R)-S-oxide reductase [Candidatus Kerfeldbacteria bacterium RIFCSPHIGHO2_12_FULL_48_17]|uniref:peptide-methionine (R)-S-oxide reductase n=1 Tax=Candidatus Kerfeldbacteria bacterium RIFCSPHIGHO2_12_FULL_48_17 TaxID=1798542 RepID=A0A1G2BA87_9BACT|nr:MAG: peptide-methionine (R)-S-oxide reductase [Candidatus Kerfeldbacteria bacterium RIFCSPHIGHO2_12_FULL_48_17]
MPKTENEWKKKLTPEQYRVLREKGTEQAFTGAYTDNKDDGMYHCAGCGAALFASDNKFESGTGWPSFDRAAAEGAVKLKTDMAHGMTRTEVVCAKCGGHLGHVFNDGPKETTCQRFCINSTALDFEKKNNVV